MPIHFRVDEPLGLVEVIFEGRVTEAELDDATASYLTPEYAHLPLGLFDTTRVTEADVPSTAVRSAVRRVSEAVDPAVKQGRLAIVAEQEEFFGLGRMYQILRDPSPVEVKVFGRRRDALRWLGLPLEDEPA